MSKETEPQTRCISEQAALIQKWDAIISKCGNLETEEQRYLLANTLETLRNKAMGKGDVTLEPENTLNVVNPAGTKRLVLNYDDEGGFSVTRQYKDWIDE